MVWVQALGSVAVVTLMSLVGAVGLQLRGEVLQKGLVIFVALEKVLHWHHAHYPHDDVIHPVAISNLVGDGLHNLLDGSLIGASYLVSPTVGLATTIAVVLHEIPQELGDFGILVHSGVEPKKALRLNLLTGSTALLG